MTLPRAAAVYVRISSDPKGLRLGVERQKQDCEALAARLGWNVAEVYEDNDISASKGLRRPAFEQMKDDVESGLRDGVIVYNTDRLTRRLTELADFLRWREEVNVPYADTEGADTATANGRMIIHIKGAVAQQEAERISERVKRAYDQRAADGKPHGSYLRAFGFEKDGITHVEEEAAAIRQAAARVLAGEPLGAIAADLDRAGIRPVKAATWNVTSLRQMLCRPRLAGIRQHRGKEVGPAVWEPILDETTWRSVRAILTDPERATSPTHNVRKYLLSGIARCGKCGAPVVAKARNRTAPPGYACPDRSGGGKSCVRRSMQHVEALLNLLVTDHLDGYQAAPELQEEAEERPPGPDLEQLTTLWAAGELSAEAYALATRKVEENSARRVQEAARRSSDRARSAALAGPNAVQLWQSGALHRRRDILTRLFAAIEIHPTTRRGRGFDPASVVVRLRASDGTPGPAFNGGEWLHEALAEQSDFSEERKQALARALGVSTLTVNHWSTYRGPVEAEKAAVGAEPAASAGSGRPNGQVAR